MPLSAGETFAGYRIVRLLGSGGMGEVYLAEHPRLPRRDALKVLLAEVSAAPDYRERFIREADLAAKLWHPNIVGVHDRGEFDGQLWIAMDYVAGTNAADLLRNRYPDGMPADDVIKTVTAVASALDYAHKQGLLHRDVKPANIMLTDPDEDGQRRILLSDFGIARAAGEISGLTATNMTVGTVAYAAPEQLMGEELDGRADQYALAASTYHMLTGSQLFPHSNAAVVISRHLNSPPPVVADTRPELGALDPVLAKALAKDPDERFPRCSDFARALADPSYKPGLPFPTEATKPALLLTESEPAVAQTPAGKPKWRQSAVGRLRRRWLVPAAFITIVLLAGIIALTWHFWGRGRPTATTANPPSSAVQSPGPSIGPPSPPLFPAKSIDQVLLTAKQLSTVLGVEVTDDPSLGGFALAMDSSSYGTSDHAGQVTPRSCVGVVFTGEYEVYSATNVQAIKTQTFGSLYGRSSGRGPYLLQQTAVVFGSAEEAQRILSSSQAQWDACSKTEVHATFGYENVKVFALGSVERQGDLLTMPMAAKQFVGTNPGIEACLQVLGVRENVVVGTRSCNYIEQSPDILINTPADPKQATNDAARKARAMLDKVKV